MTVRVALLTLLIVSATASKTVAATVAPRFPDLTCPEFMAALQAATAAAEQKVRPHWGGRVGMPDKIAITQGSDAGTCDNYCNTRFVCEWRNRSSVFKSA